MGEKMEKEKNIIKMEKQNMSENFFLMVENMSKGHYLTKKMK